MKRLLNKVLPAVLVLTLIPAMATAQQKGRQEVEGSIDMVARHPQDLNACFAGAHRRINVVGQEQINGVVGYHFDVDPATSNKNFVLEVTGGQGPVDLDIIFYTEFGTLQQATDLFYAPPSVTYDTRAPGGEANKVPPKMKKAIVCMFEGAAASFTYTAGKGVKPPKK